MFVDYVGDGETYISNLQRLQTRCIFEVINSLYAVILAISTLEMCTKKST